MMIYLVRITLYDICFRFVWCQWYHQSPSFFFFISKFNLDFSCECFHSHFHLKIAEHNSMNNTKVSQNRKYRWNNWKICSNGFILFTLLISIYSSFFKKKPFHWQKKQNRNPKQKLQIKKLPAGFIIEYLRKIIILQMKYYCKAIHLNIQYISFRPLVISFGLFYCVFFSFMPMSNRKQNDVVRYAIRTANVCL